MPQTSVKKAASSRSYASPLALAPRPLTISCFFPAALAEVVIARTAFRAAALDARALPHRRLLGLVLRARILPQSQIDMQPLNGVRADTELGCLFVEWRGNILAEPAFFFFSQYAATHPVSPCFVCVKIVYTI